MKRVLAVRACAVGDFVLNLPAIQALSNSLGGAEFTFAGYPTTLQLAQHFVRVKAVRSIDTPPWSHLFNRPMPDLDFDMAVVWMKDPAIAANLRASGVPGVIRADPFPKFGHAADHLLRTLNLGRPPLPSLWRPGGDDIILHPGSGSAKKCWPYFEQLGKMLPNSAVLLGPNEDGHVTQQRLLRGLSLTEVLTRLQACRAYIGNDSGITHLAAYIGCPTVALFGATDPRIWGPIGRRVRIIWKNSLGDILPEEVTRLV
jgi:ADP-heptose:LPS heptosyltransferase